jgi:hypothetical protein
MAKSNNRSGVRIGGAGLAGLKDALELLTKNEVLVGFPEDGAERQDGEDPTNAMLGYIHDNGAPEANIPARPFMLPGIEAVQDAVADKLGQTMRAVLRGDGPQRVEQGFTQIGFLAMNSIKRTINAGVPPPLSDFTLRARMKSGRKNGGGARIGAAQELDRRWDGQAPSTEFAKPLVDTGQMRNAVTYALRPRKRG